MLQRSLFSTLIVGLALSTAQAAETNRSEFFWQAAGGTTNVTPHLSYRALTSRDKTPANAADEKLSGLTDTGISAEYGLNEMIAIGVDLSFSSLEEDPGGGNATRKVSGLQDPRLFVKGTHVLDFGRFRYGANLGLGFQNEKIENNLDRSVSSGGFSISPYLGLDIDAGPGILGARAFYSLGLGDRTVEIGATEGKASGGNDMNLAVFYEYFLSDMLLAADLHYNMSSEETVRRTGLADIRQNAANTTGLGLYGRIPMGEAAAIIPRLNYDFANSDQDKWSDMTLSLAARFVF